ncbi:TPA: hypothetical protein IAA87_08400 [Candidatus Avigastranaerophilus faecigallinarum]|nr:hypothetical protein [Candidatus Avigastranaerophilus faecigallinarum]
MQKIKQFILFNKFNLLLLILWLIVVLFTMFHHEIWRDEAQAWCIVRDLNFIEIFRSARTEGHPFLWYLILYPFAKLGFPVEIMQVISLFFVFISISFLLFKSPFNKFEKSIICFSAGMLYYLPVVARNYSMIPIFLFLLAYFYPNRNKHPFLYILIIILLSQTHVYMLGVCAILSCLFIFESIKNKIVPNIKSLVILLVYFLFVFFVFIDTPSENYALVPGVNNIIPFNQLVILISTVFVFPLMNILVPLQKYSDFISLVSLIPFLFLITYCFFKSDKKIFLIFSFSVGFMLFVFTKVYFNGILYQKSFLIFLIVLFCYWLYKQENKQVSKLLAFSFNWLFIISMIISPIVISQEIKYNFSGGKEIAQYIKNNLEEEDVFIAIGNPYLFSPICAYLPNKKFYNTLSSNYISYYSYASQNKSNKREFPSNAEYSIVHEDIQIINKDIFDFKYKSSKKNLSSNTQREVFAIYSLK